MMPGVDRERITYYCRECERLAGELAKCREVLAALVRDADALLSTLPAESVLHQMVSLNHGDVACIVAKRKLLYGMIAATKEHLGEATDGE